jgi:hypothetical protein
MFLLLRFFVRGFGLLIDADFSDLSFFHVATSFCQSAMAIA